MPDPAAVLRVPNNAAARQQQRADNGQNAIEQQQQQRLRRAAAAATTTTTQTLGRPHAYYYNSTYYYYYYSGDGGGQSCRPRRCIRIIVVFTICVYVFHTPTAALAADRGKSLRYAPPRGAPVIFTRICGSGCLYCIIHTTAGLRTTTTTSREREN